MIKKLSHKIIAQIAAGEVISKPYNAVKELIENAIDANSSIIEIFFEEYGMKSIIIKDNGHGMTQEDLILSIQLHTTSKTEESDTMFGINYFGFRGEALASINAISNLIIESNGLKFENKKITTSTLSKGTKITVNNLFKNVPARLKYIKNFQTEFKSIKDLIKKFLIQHHKIEWHVYHNNKIIWNLKPASKSERLQSLFNEDPINESRKSENIEINAYIFKKQYNNSIIFVNQRIIKDKAIFKYITSLFKEYTFIHENPSYILEITIDPLLIDYNVHPSKEEVKFMNYTEIFAYLNEIFAMHIMANKLNEHIIFHNETPTFKPTPNNINIKNTTQLSEKYLIKEDTINDFHYANQEISTIKIEKNIQENIFKKEEISFRIIGQLQQSYILFENEKGLGIFDQHAAHERDIYEELKNNLKQENTQQLLHPIKLQLSNEIQIFLEENIHTLKKQGIVLKNKHIIALPKLINIESIMKKFNTLKIPCNLEIEIDRLLANIACKKALKANTPLSIQQMHTLLQKSLINPPICNHGRPVFKYFSTNEILNFFKR